MAVVVIDTIKPKNQGTFPVVEAADVKVTNDKRLDTALNEKANASTVEALSTAVAGKASQSDVTALQTAVAGKASQSDLNALSSTVSNKADKSALEETNAAVAGKQAALTEAQLAACNSGITSELVTQIGTNTTAIAGKASQTDLDALSTTVSGKASTSDVTTATENLQSQIDAIVTPSTQDSEVINARVDAKGTTHASLKARIDSTETKSINYKGSLVSGDSIDSTSLDVGVYYCSTTNTGGTFPETGSYLLTVSGYSGFIQQNIVNLVNGKEFVRARNNNVFTSWAETTVTSFPYYKGSLTSSDDIDDVKSEGVYFLQRSDEPAHVPAVAQFALLRVEGAANNYLTQTFQSLGKPQTRYFRSRTTTWSEWIKECVDESGLTNAISTVDTNLSNITGYVKPNIFDNQWTTTTNNGITFTVNSDKSVSIKGTATANAYIQQSITLPAGSYIISGCTGGSTQTYHIIFNLPAGGAGYQYDSETIISPASEFTTPFIIRVMQGTTVDTTIYPMIRDASVSNPMYVPHGKYQIYKPLQSLVNYTQFSWSGKKINVIGDSIVQGSYGNFVNVVKAVLNLSVARNYGVGGSCMASSSADTQYSPVVSRYSDMDNDADIVVVHAGTNDYSGQIPLGDATSTDITTFNGALNTIMAGLRDKYPTALVIFNSILHRYNDNQLTIPASEYRAAIEDRCLAHHMVFYDCYKYSGFDFVKGYYDHILTPDGLHPNQTGANILGRKLAGFINWN